MQASVVEAMGMLFEFLMLFQFLLELLSLVLELSRIEILGLILVVVFVIVNFLQVQSAGDEAWLVELLRGFEVLGVERVMHLLMTEVNDLVDLFGRQLLALAAPFAKTHCRNLVHFGGLRERRPVFDFDELLYLLAPLGVALAGSLDRHILRQQRHVQRLVTDGPVFIGHVQVFRETVALNRDGLLRELLQAGPSQLGGSRPSYQVTLPLASGPTIDAAVLVLVVFCEDGH